MRPSNLVLRLATAAVGLPLVLALAWAGGWPFALAAGLVAALAAAELLHGFLLPSMPLAAVAPQAMWLAIPAITAAGPHWDGRYAWAGAVLAALFALAGYAPTNAFGPRKPYRIIALAIVYIGLPLAILVLLRDGEDGRGWVLLVLLAAFAVDTAAYAVGRLVGRHRMAPGISPGKTWEGAAGALLLGGAAVVALALLLDVPGEPWQVGLLAALVPTAAVLGDLFESWLKRCMGVKDASGFLPGHGGLLDRLDSVLFLIPLAYAFSRL